MVLYDLFHDPMTKIDPPVVSYGKSNDLHHFGYSMKPTDLGCKDMTNYGEEKVPFLREVILINDPWNHVVLIQRALYPGEEP